LHEFDDAPFYSFFVGVNTVTGGVRVRRHFGARGTSSVRYGTRLGDLKNKQPTHTCGRRGATQSDSSQFSLGNGSGWDVSRRYPDEAERVHVVLSHLIDLTDRSGQVLDLT
jgi:hypothetical protein